MQDRRRSANVAMIGLGVFLMSLGRFAAFGGHDPLFTHTLAKAGMEQSWGWTMILVGAFKIAAGCGCMRWMDEQPHIPRSSVVAHLTSGAVLLWTWIVCGLLYGLSTPTIEACGAVGLVLLIGGYVEARKAKVMRCGRRLAV